MGEAKRRKKLDPNFGKLHPLGNRFYLMWKAQWKNPRLRAMANKPDFDLDPVFVYVFDKELLPKVLSSLQYAAKLIREDFPSCIIYILKTLLQDKHGNLDETDGILHILVAPNIDEIEVEIPVNDGNIVDIL